MTSLTQARQLTMTHAFFSFGQTDTLTLAYLARLMPEQIVGAYSLISRHNHADKPSAPRRQHLGDAGFGMFYPK